MIPIDNALATIQFGGEVWVVPIHGINNNRDALVAIHGKFQFLQPTDITYGQEDPLRNIKRGNRLIVHFAGHPLCGVNAGKSVTLESELDKRIAVEEWESAA